MLLIIISWIIFISLFTLFASWYVRKYSRPDALIGLYVAFVIFSNLAATKIASFDLGFTTIIAPAAVLVFSVTFLLTDIMNEKFGKKETQRMIFIAFLSQIVFVVFSWLAISLPSAPFWNNQESFKIILGSVPQITFASWSAFLISENLDAYLFAWFKVKTKNKHLWLRNTFSSIPAMAVDSVLFVVIAYNNFSQLISVAIGLTFLKWLVALIDIPFMYLNRKIMS